MSKHDGHDYHGPTDHKNSDESDSCAACVLAYCKTCHGGEASLPKECPGRAMTGAEQDAVQARTLNYNDGKWWFATDYKEPEFTSKDGTVRKAHYGDGRQPWDDIKDLGWAFAFAAGNVLKYMRRTKDVTQSREKARWYWRELTELSNHRLGRNELDQLIYTLTVEELAFLETK